MARLTPEQRKTAIVAAAVRLSNCNGLYGWTREQLAQECEIVTSLGTTKHYFPVVDDLRKLVLEHDDALPHLQTQAVAMGLVREHKG